MSKVVSLCCCQKQSCSLYTLSRFRGVSDLHIDLHILQLLDSWLSICVLNVYIECTLASSSSHWGLGLLSLSAGSLFRVSSGQLHCVLGALPVQLQGVMATCCSKNTEWWILPVHLGQNASLECFHWVKSQARAGKDLQVWCSLSGCGKHDVVFLTPVSLCQPPTLSPSSFL